MKMKLLTLESRSHAGQLVYVPTDDLKEVFEHCTNRSWSIWPAKFEVMFWPIFQAHGFTNYEITPIKG